MRTIIYAATVVALIVPASAQVPTAGYLDADARPDLTVILPGPPAAGSPRARADAAVFRESRALAGGARWRTASEDVSSDLPQRFAAALGGRLDLSALPATRRLLDRLGADRSALIGAAKAHWRSPRPFVGSAAPICEPRRADLVSNGDYPSGHAAHGWSFALVMAELLPDRAGAILARGRAYGDSRWICGSHSTSAVEGGFLAAAAIVAAEHGAPAFRADLESARAELARWRTSLRSAS
ncbi:acid phosphatase [Sphingomonas yunnanensis]|uniref:acid phosphatase n=1 Tax=Sphingomonas yunnanensis TaxID=310400 RepID=UPI001FE3094F|nr:phosphatase PAP2 family protein [Sphingomonas yunnanensis]